MTLKMTPKRLSYVLTGCLVFLAILAIAGAVAGNGMLTSQNRKLTDLKLEKQVLEKQKEALVQAKSDLERYAELEQVAKQIVPQEKDQVRTVREIVGFANGAQIDIASIGFPGSELGEGTNVNLTQLEPVEGLNNVYRMEISVDNGSPAQFFGLIDFLRRLESNRRTSQVSSITITPNQDNRNLLQFNVTMNVYIKPEGGAEE